MFNDLLGAIILKVRSIKYWLKLRRAKQMRIPMLNSFSPPSPILHLVRNGIDVVRSIDRLAGINTYPLGGKGDWNQWWGRDNCKWTALSNDAISAGWFADEVPLIDTNQQMGA